jgi:hypothetical protein
MADIIKTINSIIIDGLIQLLSSEIELISTETAVRVVAVLALPRNELIEISSKERKRKTSRLINPGGRTAVSINKREKIKVNPKRKKNPLQLD